ncbi:MAG TPA: hypothetical protein GX697_05350 [Firmicutes bacterium]|nr:hypothetical protein [Bacillota bacterium]
MEYWLDLVMILLLIKGAVTGYLAGAGAGAMKTVLLLPALWLAGLFSNGGAVYLETISKFDELLKPLVASRFPLALAVSPPLGGEMAAAALVRGLPLPPLYQERLAGMPEIMELPAGSPALEAVIEKFTSLIILKGAFLFFFLILLIAMQIIIKLKRDNPFPPRGKLTGLLLGGLNTGIVSAFLVEAFCPFLPLFGTFVAWDISRSPVLEALLKIAFTLGVK